MSRVVGQNLLTLEDEQSSPTTTSIDSYVMKLCILNLPLPVGVNQSISQSINHLYWPTNEFHLGYNVFAVCFLFLSCDVEQNT